jgi:DNA-binding NtrC family response regulator
MTILLIDDDDDFRSGLAENLREDGHEVREYSHPGAIPRVELLGNVTAVIIDYQMREQDGLAFADRFHASFPEVPIVLVTAFWTHNLDAAVAARSYVHLRRKPFDYEDISSLLLRTASRDGTGVSDEVR